MRPEWPRDTIVRVPGSLRAGRQPGGAESRAGEPGRRRVVQPAGTRPGCSQAKAVALPVAGGWGSRPPWSATATATTEMKTTTVAIATKLRQRVMVLLTSLPAAGFR